jgi:hypothetical protein
MRFPSLAIIAVAMCPILLVGAQKEFQVKVNVSLVSVDVGVFDRKGDAVTTLRQEDFLVFEDGQAAGDTSF